MPLAAGPASGAVGGAVLGGWHAATQVHVQHAGSEDLGRLLVGLVLAMVVVGGIALARLMHNPLRSPRLRLTANFPERRIEDVGISVGPWTAAGWRPPVEVVVLLSGGPLPVETGEWVRWMRNGDVLRLGPGPNPVRARPLRDDGVWIHLSADAAAREGPAALR